MNRRLSTAQSIPAFLAVLLLLVANSSHIHLRYCLDGDEAPVSIHFETDDSHPSDEDFASSIAESDQADFESELSLDTRFEKSSNTSIDTVAISNVYSPAATAKSLTLFIPQASESLPNKPATLLPPSRASPVIA